MKRIAVLFGREDTFPWALIDRINAIGGKQIRAVPAQIDGVLMERPADYRVIIDRISQDVPFYRAYLKHAVLGGAVVINNPFWWTADDKFFNYALASRLGVAVPRTVLLPHNQHPPDITAKSLRNLKYPLDWDAIFAYVGFPAFLKPYAGGGWKHVYKVHNPEELFHHYNQTGDLCMTLQQAIEYEEYYRCYVVGMRRVHIMRYDPSRPHAERYVQDGPPIPPERQERLIHDCLTLCRALGYEMNTVEFAVKDGVPYAIDFLNPAPDADYHSVGEANFRWFVDAMAELAVTKAKERSRPVRGYRWSRFLQG